MMRFPSIELDFTRSLSGCKVPEPEETPEKVARAARMEKLQRLQTLLLSLTQLKEAKDKLCASRNLTPSSVCFLIALCACARVDLRKFAVRAHVCMFLCWFSYFILSLCLSVFLQYSSFPCLSFLLSVFLSSILASVFVFVLPSCPYYFLSCLLSFCRPCLSCTCMV